MGCKKKYISSKDTKLCIGSMGYRIEIQKRNVQYKGTKSEYSFTTSWTVWADIETRSGVDKFSGIVVEDSITHIFKIRSISGLTSEYWVNWNDQRFEIQSIETLNEGSYMLLYSKNTGAYTLDGASA